ncbi:MAG: anti-sigma factor family protein [Fidelibacterota bacterium]
MNRYEFEDAISAYIENELPLARRKEFETYLEIHPDARELVQAVKKTKQYLTQLPPVKASLQFMAQLDRRKSLLKDQPLSRPSKFTGNTIFRFPPIYAGLMTVLVVAFVFIGIQLLPSSATPELTKPQFSKIVPPTVDPVTPPQNNSDLYDSNFLAESEKDSSDSLINSPKQRFPLNDRIRLVKDQH